MNLINIKLKQSFKELFNVYFEYMFIYNVL